MREYSVKTEYVHFPNIGYLKVFFDQETLKPIKDEIDEMLKTHFVNHEIVGNKLAGHIKHEYKLKKSHNHILELMRPLIKHYDSHHTSQQTNLELMGAWVNFQSKHEFNPLHNHVGDFSFVIFLQIPYSLCEEDDLDFVKVSNTKSAGRFSFFYNNVLGQTDGQLIHADKTMENTGIIFPALMPHTVYPFYTSDDYRITVSGNFRKC